MMIGREPAAAHEVACPHCHCHAASGTPCVSSEGKPRYLVHIARLHLAAVGAAPTHAGIATLVAVTA